jgi:hypothetical protein
MLDRLVACTWHGLLVSKGRHASELISMNLLLRYVLLRHRLDGFLGRL